MKLYRAPADLRRGDKVNWTDDLLNDLLICDLGVELTPTPARITSFDDLKRLLAAQPGNVWFWTNADDPPKEFIRERVLEAFTCDEGWHLRRSFGKDCVLRLELFTPSFVFTSGRYSGNSGIFTVPVELMVASAVTEGDVIEMARRRGCLDSYIEDDRPQVCPAAKQLIAGRIAALEAK